MNKRLDNLQILRAIAIIMIFLSHSSFLLGFDSTGLGAVGVSVFIVLSGFLTAYNHYGEADNSSYSIRDSIEYTKVRIRKFYLLHFLTFFAALLLDIAEFVMYGFSKNDIALELIKAPINLLLLQSYIPERSIYFSFNSVSWYLSAIVFFYFCTPFIIKTLKKVKMKKIFILLLVYIVQILITVIFSNTQYAHAVLYINPIFRVLDYIVGIIGGIIFLEVRDRYKNDKSFEFGSITEIIVIFVFIIAFLCYEIIPKGFAYCVFYEPFSLAMVFVLAFNEGIISKIGRLSIFNYIGKISLEIFMVHQLVIRYLILANELKFGIATTIVWACSLAVTVLLSHIIFVCKEKRVAGK